MPDPVSSPRVEVVGIGATTWDEFWVVDEFPEGECVIAASECLGSAGGPVATALALLSHQGHRCALVDVQGDDATGAAIRSELAAVGVSLEFVQSVPGSRSTRAAVFVRKSDGARQIVYAPATAGEPAWTGREASLVRQARLLHLNGRHEQAARCALQVARETGVTVSFDGGAGRYRECIRNLVLGSQLRIVALDFARQFTGENELEQMMAALLEPPAALVVITDGVRGSWIAVPGMPLHHAPAQVAARVVDTTGCGDVYHGAFLHGWLSGWPPRECASYASAMAAKNAEGLGGKFVLASGGLKAAQE